VSPNKSLRENIQFHENCYSTLLGPPPVSVAGREYSAPVRQYDPAQTPTTPTRVFLNDDLAPQGLSQLHPDRGETVDWKL
jgi:hypothetical protein